MMRKDMVERNAVDGNFKVSFPERPMEFTGERMTTAIDGQIEFEHFHRYCLARDLCAGLDVLDVASGEGYGSAILASVARSITGVEIDPESVAHAQEAYRAKNLRFLQGNTIDLPLDNASVDAVVSFETLEHVREHSRFIAEVRRVLRVGGVFIVSTPDRAVYSARGEHFNEYHMLELTEPEFESFLRADFANVAILHQRAILGSVIAAPRGSGPWRSYERRAPQFIEASGGLARAPYLIGVASDVSLPDLTSSVYVTRQTVAEATQGPQRAAAAEARATAAEAQATAAEAQATAAEARATAAEARATEWERNRDAAQTLIAENNGRATERERERDALSHALAHAAQEYARLQSQMQEALQKASEDKLRELAALKRVDYSGRIPKQLRSIWLLAPGRAKKLRRLATNYRLLAASPLFDAQWYLDTNPDVAAAKFDPMLHYLLNGAQEGRSPGPKFSGTEYQRANPDVLDSRTNPLVHYVLYGRKEGRQTSIRRESISNAPASQSVVTVTSEKTRDGEQPEKASGKQIDLEVEAIKKSGLFDEPFYRSMYPDVKDTRDDVVRHYCEHGWREGRNPSWDFDTRFYIATNTDIRNANINPFWHYVIAGASELRQGQPDAAARFESDIRFGSLETDTKLIAFYSSPDWAELRGRRRGSEGQFQPLLPHAELGLYDPSDSLVLRRQADMAKRHGLYGFCFQLGGGAEGGAPSAPVELFLAHNDVDFRFCVHIEIHSEDIPESLVASLARAVSDRRFIHMQGRPVILVTVLSEKQHAAPVFRCLKSRLADRGVVRPFVIGRFASWGDYSHVSPADLCDAVLDLPIAPVPGETGYFVPMDKNGVDVAPYGVVATQGIARIRAAQKSARSVFHCVTLARDNPARTPERSLVYTHFRIEEYRSWLDAAIAGARVSHPHDRRLVFVNAWNGWNEGLFLEPDRQAGFCRLNENTRALLGLRPGAKVPKVTIVVPNYNHELFLRRRLASVYGQTYKNIEVILLDDSSSDNSRSLMDEYAASYPDITTTLYSNQNSGGPFRQWAKGIKAATGDLVWIAESDDYCDERFLEVLVRSFEDEAVLLAYANCCFVDENENPTPPSFEDHLSGLECSGKWNNSYVETAHKEVATALGIINTIPNASGVLFRRPIDMPLLDDESWLSMSVAGDWIFYLNIIRGGKIAFSTETTSFFRRYQGSATAATYRKEVFYREVGTVSRTVAALYDVPLETLVRSRRAHQEFYEKTVGGSDEEFQMWYDFPSVLHARQTRLPNVMVSTMAFFPGGAEIIAIRLANEYKRQGLSVLLFSAGVYPREERVRRMLRNDVPVIDMPVIETSDVNVLKAIIHDFGVEVLNSHQWHIQKYPLLVPDVFKELRAHIASLHGMIENEKAFLASNEQLRSADQHVSTWVYTAEKNLVPFINCGLYDKEPSRFVKIPNGMAVPPRIIPISRTDIGIPESAFTLCCVSRAVPEKGWSETILVVERARAISGRDIRLILVGNGPVYDEYCSVGVPDFVYLAGFSENSVGHYAAAEMGIMLTKFKSESFPLTVVDCLFAGRPYIASDVGDIRNMLKAEGGQLAGEVIELVDWEIPVERFAQVVAAFATDRQKYAKSLSLVQDIANRYKIDAVAARYIHLFQAEPEESERPR